ncbi:Gfo/Idh/MocA family protein [Marinomonas sp. 2405UD68-3]|uniref:Gfo/Idh/MocA family protein n=1 Tax=Marinomonas sp. 2405UD68-3 TaxID=3391835 RepID=UPI0039C962A0
MNSYRKIKIGFIGAGFIGQIAHIENYSQLNNCELHAIADLRVDLREQVADKFSIKYRYNSHKDLLTDSNVDAVIVVTARSHTVDIVRDCLLANKHVFSEKPMAHNSDLAAELVHLAEERKLIYCVGYMKRFDEGVNKAKEIFDSLISTQNLGKLLQINAQCYMGNSYCNAGGYIHSTQSRPDMLDEEKLTPSWLLDYQKPHFARYLNVHSHLLNLIRYFIDKQLHVEYFNYISELAHVCVLRTDEQLITLQTGDVNQRNWQEICVFIFESGQLKVQLPPALLRNVPARITLIQGNNNDEKTEYLINWSWSFKHQAISFINTVTENEFNSSISARQALVDIKLVEEIWKKIKK